MEHLDPKAQMFGLIENLLFYIKTDHDLLYFQFSSSPIKSACTPQLHRQSLDSKFLSSPELSPIVHGNITGMRLTY